MEIGKEGLRFENGAFTYYGVSALTLPSSGKRQPLLGPGSWRPFLQCHASYGVGGSGLLAFPSLGCAGGPGSSLSGLVFAAHPQPCRTCPRRKCVCQLSKVPGHWPFPGWFVGCVSEAVRWPCSQYGLPITGCPFASSPVPSVLAAVPPAAGTSRQHPLVRVLSRLHCEGPFRPAVHQGKVIVGSPRGWIPWAQFVWIESRVRWSLRLPSVQTVNSLCRNMALAPQRPL